MQWESLVMAITQQLLTQEPSSIRISVNEQRTSFRWECLWLSGQLETAALYLSKSPATENGTGSTSETPTKRAAG